MFPSQMRKWKWAIKNQLSIEQTQFPKHSKWELGVTATVPIIWELLWAFTGGWLLVRAIFQTFTSFSKKKASLGCFLLRDSLRFLSSANYCQELTWTPLWLLLERHSSTCQAGERRPQTQELSGQKCMQAVGHQRGQTGDWQAGLRPWRGKNPGYVKQDMRVSHKLHSKEPHMETLKMGKTRNMWFQATAVFLNLGL